MVWDGPTHLPLGEVATALHRRVASALRSGDRVLQNTIESCATQWVNLIPSPGRLFADAFTSTSDRALVVQTLLFFVQCGCIKDFEDWTIDQGQALATYIFGSEGPANLGAELIRQAYVPDHAEQSVMSFGSHFQFFYARLSETEWSTPWSYDRAICHAVLHPRSDMEELVEEAIQNNLEAMFQIPDTLIWAAYGLRLSGRALGLLVRRLSTPGTQLIPVPPVMACMLETSDLETIGLMYVQDQMGRIHLLPVAHRNLPPKATATIKLRWIVWYIVGAHLDGLHHSVYATRW